GRQRLEPGALARDADTRATEPGRRLGAVGVRAAGLISSELRLRPSLAHKRRPTLRPGNTDERQDGNTRQQTRTNQPNTTQQIRPREGHDAGESILEVDRSGIAARLAP